jgi:phosphoribosylpyrophosphate synthetase
MKEYDVVLASGAEHLRGCFEKHGYRVFSCAMNYDGHRMFPNADVYARIPDVDKLSDRRVVVVQSCTGSGPSDKEPFTTSDRVVELLLILDILAQPYDVEELGHKQYRSKPIAPPSHVEVVLTFQPYALQDKAFKTGEAISCKWAAEQIARACNKVWVVNPHAKPDLPWVRSISSRGVYQEIDIMPDLIRFAAARFGFDNYSVITPDEGGQERFAVEGFGKKRTDSYSVELSGSVKVKGKKVILIDDLTKSGATLLKAADRLRAQGASDVGLAVVHVMPLADKGEQLLENLVEKSSGRIVTSNTIYTRIFCERRPEHTYNVVESLVKVI